jgi:hypothetical protein
MALESKRNHVDRVTMGRTPPLSFDKTVRAGLGVRVRVRVRVRFRVFINYSSNI